MHGVLDEERGEVEKLLQGIVDSNRDDYDRIKCMQLDWPTDALKKILSEYMQICSCRNNQYKTYDKVYIIR